MIGICIATVGHLTTSTSQYHYAKVGEGKQVRIGGCDGGCGGDGDGVDVRQRSCVFCTQRIYLVKKVFSGLE